ncbi:MAG TPA: NADH-quinone oxidoreductase subunit A [Oligoflexia bacterium]|nr:NADH-quinone oxidoreductase subunit A [Oligoflexia bacterium]
MYHQFGAVLVFILVGAAFVTAGLLAGRLIRPRLSAGQKHAIYECGEPTIGSSWIRYNSRFYNVALVYLLFDVEVIILVPALLVFREKTAAGFAAAPLVCLLFFIFLLALGLAYEWFYGNLDWIRSADALIESSPAFTPEKSSVEQ